MKTKNFAFIFLSVACSSIVVFGQKTINDLKPAHAQVLRRFLAANKQHSFLSVTKISPNYIKEMRENLGESFQPYYLADDFNADGKTDFAVILARKGARKINRGVTSPEHKFSYPLTVVVFNGAARGTFTKALTTDVEAPYVSFLTVPEGDEKILHYGVYETDAYDLDFKPLGKSYRAEASEMP